MKDTIVVRGGRVVDKDSERLADIAITNGVITEVASSIDPPSGARVLDAAGCIVSPGLVDLHTHLRQPGGESAETVASGANAAALGGFTAVVAMPNTIPAIDSADVVRDIYALRASVRCDVAVAGAITVGRLGERLSEMGAMAELGVRLFTDDGTGVQDAGLMRRALEYARDLNVTLAQHCEDAELARGGHMHEGEVSSRLGIKGQPGLAEEAMVARDLALVELIGTKMHFLHLSTGRSAELLAEAKRKGLPVTGEVTPHHLNLTDDNVASFDPVFKVNPPLRTGNDVAALRRACAAGIFDAIATDHAPHPQETKERSFETAPPGMLGLETALAVSYDALCRPHDDGTAPMSLQDFFAMLCWQPAAIAELDVTRGQGGPIAAGATAHLCIFDPEEQWSVVPGESASKSRNTPFAGRQLTGKVRHTIYQGIPVVINGALQ